jgi:hypothetical protein
MGSVGISPAAPAKHITVGRTSSSAALAQAIISKVNKDFFAEIGYQGTSHIRLFTGSPDGKPVVASEFDLNSTIERPNLLSLVTTQNSHVGVLVLADSTGVTVFNAPKLIYTKETAVANTQDLISSIQRAGQGCLAGAQMSQLQLSLTMPSMFLKGSIDIGKFAPPGAVKDSVLKTTDDGKPVYQLIQSLTYPNKSKIDFAFMVNIQTDAPVSFSEYAVTVGGMYVPLIQQEYSKFIPLKAHLPAVGYAFNPPPGSVQVTAN